MCYALVDMNRNKFVFISRKTQNFTSKTLADIEQIKKTSLPGTVNRLAKKSSNFISCQNN